MRLFFERYGCRVDNKRAEVFCDSLQDMLAYCDNGSQVNDVFAVFDARQNLLASKENGKWVLTEEGKTYGI